LRIDAAIFDAAIFAAALVMAPLGARAADLVVWWEKRFYAQEDEAVAEIAAAFAQKTGKQVELVQPTQDEMFDRIQPALAAGQPPRSGRASIGPSTVSNWCFRREAIIALNSSEQPSRPPESHLNDEAHVRPEVHS
jgi:hypothetical protein